MSELVVRGLEKRFGTTTVLRGLDLAVPGGTLAAVLGPSGCGKTTLLRIVAGFERADAGVVVVGGRTVAAPGVDVPPERRRVGMVPQEGALFPHLSVARNVGYGLRRRGRSGGRVDEVLALVGLDGYGDRMPHQLSGGQQQRVALARALAPRPSLILLDEPFSSLDAGLRADLRRDVRAALHADGATAILVTHDQAEALSLADEVAVMRAGRVVQAGTPASVYRTPADPWVTAFVGEAGLLPGTARDGHAETAAGTVPLLPLPPLPLNGDPVPVTVLIRPEQLHLTAGTPVGGAGVPAKVVRRDYFGHDTLTVVRLADGTELASRRLGGDEQVRAGSVVTLRITGPVLAWPAARQ